MAEPHKIKVTVKGNSKRAVVEKNVEHKASPDSSEYVHDHLLVNFKKKKKNYESGRRKKAEA